MHRYKNLQVWQRSIELAVDIYRITEKLPKQEQYGLISQINRAVISIPSNIAEGAGRNTNKEFNNFLGYSLGSSFELNTHLIISNRLNYIDDFSFEKAIEELAIIQNMLVKLKQSLNN